MREITDVYLQIQIRRLQTLLGDFSLFLSISAMFFFIYLSFRALNGVGERNWMVNNKWSCFCMSEGTILELVGGSEKKAWKISVRIADVWVADWATGFRIWSVKQRSVDMDCRGREESSKTVCSELQPNYTKWSKKWILSNHFLLYCYCSIGGLLHVFPPHCHPL